jgi:hypothetical protein
VADTGAVQGGRNNQRWDLGTLVISRKMELDQRKKGVLEDLNSDLSGFGRRDLDVLDGERLGGFPSNGGLAVCSKGKRQGRWKRVERGDGSA